MKRWIGILCAIALVCTGASAFAKTDVLRLDGMFALTFDGTPDTQACAMSLLSGNVLTIHNNCVGGSVSITIRHNNGDLLYQNTAGTPSVETVKIPADDVYRITVTASGATKGISISVGPRAYFPDGDQPFVRRHVVGSFGYSLEYDPDLFAFAKAADMDTFAEQNATSATRIQATLLPKDMSIDAYINSLMTMSVNGTIAELPAEVIDWRVARTIRVEAKLGDMVRVVRDTVIETGENKAFLFSASYPLEREAEALAILLPMLGSLQFTE